MTKQTIWVGIEMSRYGKAGGGLEFGGVNLLGHQLRIALQLTGTDHICVLTPQGDEESLAIAARHEVREVAPYDFIAMLSERARAGEEGAVVLLRQIAPVRDSGIVKQALHLLHEHPVVVSACPKDEPCLAFEVRRISQFSAAAIANPLAGEYLMEIDPSCYAEYTRPEHAQAVTDALARWNA
ncbi:MAG: hypothetical protein KF696_00450 [Planctomycetes bacterium]|nr:hypothetical protein [Planctomycetota bacterium]MCW8134591.1 hypothetical protein [Planctomycetota bacterium]